MYSQKSVDFPLHGPRDRVSIPTTLDSSHVPGICAEGKDKFVYCLDIVASDLRLGDNLQAGDIQNLCFPHIVTHTWSFLTISTIYRQMHAFLYLFDRKRTRIE